MALRTVARVLPVPPDRPRPRLEVAVPDDLAAALDEAGLRERFDALPYSHRKQHVLAVQDARSEGTRARRIRTALQTLREG